MSGIFNRPRKTVTKMFRIPGQNDIGTYLATLKIGTNVVIGDILNEKFLKLHALSHSRKVHFRCLNQSPLKMIKNPFYFTLKVLFIISRYLDFCPHFYGHVGKQFDKRTMVNFKICNIKNWETNNCNIHFTQYLKKKR